MPDVVVKESGFLGFRFHGRKFGINIRTAGAVLFCQSFCLTGRFCRQFHRCSRRIEFLPDTVFNGIELGQSAAVILVGHFGNGLLGVCHSRHALDILQPALQ